MYKLIAIDLDGTLLNSYGTISEKNKEAIKKAQNMGSEVVVSSGRTIQSAKSFANEVGANNYLICGNGSMLYDVQNQQILYKEGYGKKYPNNIMQGGFLCAKLFYKMGKYRSYLYKYCCYDSTFYIFRYFNNKSRQ